MTKDKKQRYTFYCDWPGCPGVHESENSRCDAPVPAPAEPAGEKRAIDRPCSACTAGDYKMEYHDHFPPFRVEPVAGEAKRVVDDMIDNLRENVTEDKRRRAAPAVAAPAEWDVTDEMHFRPMKPADQFYEDVWRHYALSPKGEYAIFTLGWISEFAEAFAEQQRAATPPPAATVKEIVVFYAHTESGDQFLALLPKKFTSEEFNKYCAEHYREDQAGGTLNGRQIVLTQKGIQL